MDQGLGEYAYSTIKYFQKECSHSYEEPLFFYSHEGEYQGYSRRHDFRYEFYDAYDNYLGFINQPICERFSLEK